jgi:hypothetical protein
MIHSNKIPSDSVEKTHTAEKKVYEHDNLNNNISDPEHNRNSMFESVYYSHLNLLLV